MSAPYRVHATVKNNRLWTAIVEAFPDVKTQGDAARALDEFPGRIGDLLNMRVLPLQSNGRGTPVAWTKAARRIAERLGESPGYLFDPALYGRGRLVAQIEVTPSQLSEAGLLQLPPGPDEELERVDAARSIGRAIASLTPREQDVLTRAFGLDGGEPESVVDAATRNRVHPQTIRNVRAKAIRKLRHRSRGLREYA